MQGYSDIFIYKLCRLGVFLGGHHFKFGYFSVFRKMFSLGYAKFLGDTTKKDYFGSHLRVFLM